MPKMRLPKGVDPKSVGVDDFAALGAVTGPMGRGLEKAMPDLFKSNVPKAPATSEALKKAFDQYLAQIRQLLVDSGAGKMVK